MSDGLKQLLRNADAPPLVGDSAELAGRVWRRREAQIRQRRTGTAIAVVLLVGGTLLLHLRPAQVRRIAIDKPVRQNANVSLASLEIDAKLHAMTAQMLMALERTRRARADISAEPDPIEQVHFQRDRAAMTLIYEADRFIAQPHQTDLAIAQYRKVIELFPKSKWADVARQRLREHES